MANLWDDIAKTIREGVDTVVEKTEQLSKIGKIKVDILNIKRNIEKNFAELGGKVYHLIVEEKKTQITSDKEIKAILDSIKLLEKELEEKSEELEKVKEAGEEGKSKPKPKSASKPKAKTTPPKSKSSTAKSKTASTKSKSTSSKSKTASSSKKAGGSKPKTGTGK